VSSKDDPGNRCGGGEVWINLPENEEIRRSCLPWIRRSCLLRREAAKMCSNSGQRAYHCHSREAILEIPVNSKEIRQKLKLRPKQKFAENVEGRKIILRPLPSIVELKGVLKNVAKGKSVEQLSRWIDEGWD